MLSDWVITSVAVTILFFGIPLLFLGSALMSRIRTAWTSKFLWQSVQCPEKKTVEQVGFLEKADSLRNLKTLDAVYCTAFGDPTAVTCDKACLKDQFRR
jgi:hypothetical protein